MKRGRSRREFIRTAAMGGLAAGLFPGLALSVENGNKGAVMTGGKKDTRPNILLITNDQQSSTMMSCAGNTYLKTPAMDRLAAGGIRFSRAYCANPVCLPSRFSWYTGRRPSAIDVFNNKAGQKLDRVPSVFHDTSMPRLLKDAGYRVAYGGKTHLPGDLTPASMGCEFLTEDKRDGLASDSAAWLRERAVKRDGPFFLAANFVNPHDICLMGMRDYYRAEKANDPNLNEKERWILDDSTLEARLIAELTAAPAGIAEAAFFASAQFPPLPANHAPQAGEPEAVKKFEESFPVRRYMREKWDAKRWRQHSLAYHRLTEQVDRQIGTVLDALDEAGLAENTLVIFTSDHGDHNGSHLMDQKTVMYDEAVRIPFLMRWPGKIKAGQVDTAHTVSNGLDLLPTVCAAGGAAIPDGLEGQSLLPLAGIGTGSGFRPAMPLECEIGRGVVMGDFKYLRYNSGANSEQLMDLKNDPGETRNHLDNPANAEILQACRDAYNRYFNA